MASRDPLSRADLAAALADLPGWRLDEADGDAPGGSEAGAQRLVRAFRFADFRAAVAFIVRLAFEADAMDHHPELTNVYDRVTVALTTHDAGHRVTARDVALARAATALASEAAVPSPDADAPSA